MANSSTAPSTKSSTNSNTAAWVGMGLQAVATGMSASATARQAATQQSTLQYEAAVASNNAKMADYQASQSLVIGQQLEQNQRLKTAGNIGAERAAMAANGIDLGMGSATDIITSSTMMGNRDALTIKDNANRQQWAYAMQAQNYRSEAASDNAMASTINPSSGEIASLLAGASGVARSYQSYNASTNGANGTNGTKGP